ncbi:agamous-like MADS-box protein AGL29 [Bidens hawaiensis]|uniref:agamous-like MADS-box protein AGL29 n=1 Tax=Bidens hawaiensis TaxID=980011 RepID=UPI00404A6AA1
MNNNNIITATFSSLHATMNKIIKKKTSQGRKKIEIKKIEELNSRQVTFSKRRAGLFKKASELCILTGARIAILVNSPGGRFFAFGHPKADTIIDRYLNNNNNNNINTGSVSGSDSSSSSGNNNNNNNALAMPEGWTFNEHYLEVSKELEAEKKRREMIQETKVLKGGGLLWYEEEVDGMEVDELEQYMLSLLELKRKVLVRADELVMIKNTPICLGPSGLSGDVGVGGVGFGNEGGNGMGSCSGVPPPAGFGFGWI